MAEEGTNTNDEQQQGEVETGIARGRAIRVSMDDTDTPVVSEGGRSGGVEMDEQPPVDDANNPAKQKPEEGEDQQGDDDQQQDDKGDDDGDKDPDALPAEFKPDDAENVKKFTDRFLKDGQLQIDALSSEWWKNAGGDESKGKLNDATYDFLSKKLGVSKETVQAIEAGEVAKKRVRMSDLAASVGGSDNYNKMLDWGRDGGYTQQQREAFNAAVNGPDAAKAAEAVELLALRYAKATKSSTRPDKSAADAGRTGSGTSKGGKDVFGSKQEWLDARKEAGNDTAKQQAVMNKFYRSPGAANW